MSSTKRSKYARKKDAPDPDVRTQKSAQKINEIKKHRKSWFKDDMWRKPHVETESRRATKITKEDEKKMHLDMSSPFISKESLLMLLIAIILIIINNIYTIIAAIFFLTFAFMMPFLKKIRMRRKDIHHIKRL
ncbi:hypothetical protein HQ545_05110 [Candidatus Woesearchaeota archaeon]|nr:hypothetical protein [Candidatus Woesearchaeota archaeon]